MQLSKTVFTITCCLVATLACAQEKKLDRSALPAPVAATIEREAQGALIKGYATEREHGRKVYEAETILNGHTRDLQIAADGTLNEVEEEVTFEQLPAEIQSGLKKRAQGASITKVEALTKQGKLVAYEAAIKKGLRKGEIQMGPNGEALAHGE